MIASPMNCLSDDHSDSSFVLILYTPVKIRNTAEIEPWILYFDGFLRLEMSVITKINQLHVCEFRKKNYREILRVKKKY